MVFPKRLWNCCNLTITCVATALCTAWRHLSRRTHQVSSIPFDYLWVVINSSFPRPFLAGLRPVRAGALPRNVRGFASERADSGGCYEALKKNREQKGVNNVHFSDNTWWICVRCRKGFEILQQCWSSANHQMPAWPYTRNWKNVYWVELWMKLVDRELRMAQRCSNFYCNWCSLWHIVNFQWRDTVAPLYQFFDTKRVVLKTSVGASSTQRLEELQKMDAKYVMNTITLHMND